MSNAWHGDWRMRILTRCQQLGYGSLIELSDAHPNHSIGKLLGLLRNVTIDDNRPIALTQVASEFFQEAKGSGKLPQALARTLVHSFDQHLRKGWGVYDDSNSRRIRVFAEWQIPPEETEEFLTICEAVRSEIESFEPPDDWCPRSESDPIIVGALERAWHRCE